MLKLQRLTLILTLLMVCPAASALDFSIREWSNDTEVFVNQVLQPLHEQFQAQDCESRTNVYLVALFSRLSDIKAVVNSKSYLLLRDSVLTVAADMTPWDQQMSCDMIDRWAVIESHIRNELELIGNVLLIIE